MTSIGKTRPLRGVGGFIFAATGLLLLPACGNQPVVAQEELPAVIAERDEKTTEFLSQAISELLNGRVVEIGSSAFAESDLLVIHRRQLLGRDLGDSVERFRLVIAGEDCMLVHEDSGDKVTLHNVSCLAKVESAKAESAATDN